LTLLSALQLLFIRVFRIRTCFGSVPEI